MAVYLIAQLKIKEGCMEKFSTLLHEEIAPRLEPRGWKLLGSYLNIMGTPTPSLGGMNVVLDVWELTPDISAFERVQREIQSDMEYMPFERELAACVEDENMQFMYKLPDALGLWPME